jgi:anti-sigma factor RsiW
MSVEVRCEDVRALIEALAAGETVPDPRVAAHLAGCRRCAAGLALARRIDRILAAGPPPSLPDRFSERLFGRMRRERWRTEQYVDLGFNATLAIGLLLIVSGIVLALNLTGLVAVLQVTPEALATLRALLVERLGPALPTYAGAVALMVTALSVWWWVERRTWTGG